MVKLVKIFPEKKYKEIIEEVGPYRYCIYEKDELIPGGIFSKGLAIQDYNCVVAASGSTTSLCTLQLTLDKQVVIPKDAQVSIVRLLRYDGSHGEPHYNADDQIIFPTIEGNIFRVARRDNPDHYLKIAGSTNMFTIADAYRLPIEKTGPVNKYSAQGAKLHVKLEPYNKK